MSRRWNLPSDKARAMLRNLDEGAPLDAEPVAYDSDDVAALLKERDVLARQLENAVAPVMSAAASANEKLHVEIAARFTREQVVLAMELASGPDFTWDTMAEREVVFAEILAEVKR